MLSHLIGTAIGEEIWLPKKSHSGMGSLGKRQFRCYRWRVVKRSAFRTLKLGKQYNESLQPEATDKSI